LSQTDKNSVIRRANVEKKLKVQVIALTLPAFLFDTIVQNCNHLLNHAIGDPICIDITGTQVGTNLKAIAK